MTHDLRRARARALPACLALALGVAGCAAHAASFVTVTNCADDATPGTLRAVLAALTENNAVVDVSSCATITLTQGELALAYSTAILGPGAGTTTISADHRSRVFESTGQTQGSGSLILSNLTVSAGRVSTTYQPAVGGCISAAALTLNNSIVTDCSAHSDTNAAIGGAISATSLTLYRSTVAHNALSSGSGAAFGGGAAANQFSCIDSTLSGNEASGVPGQGGGVAVYAGATIQGCTIDTNAADNAGGVLTLGGGTATDTVTIFNSTISGNQARSVAGGASIGAALSLRNSTIADNYAPSCAGLRAQRDARLDSSIIARNRSGNAGCVDLAVTGTLTGAHDLVGADNGVLPAGTLVADPHLTPLANHGGPTRTHALLPASPAIDAGSNPGNAGTDQRDSGFARQAGAGVDIGAYERQARDDELFYGGFE